MAARQVDRQSRRLRQLLLRVKSGIDQLVTIRLAVDPTPALMPRHICEGIFARISEQRTAEYCAQTPPPAISGRFAQQIE